MVFTAICLSQPHILLLDEPTNHLDMQVWAAACALPRRVGDLLDTGGSSTWESAAAIAPLLQLAWHCPVCHAPSLASASVQLSALV